MQTDDVIWLRIRNGGGRACAPDEPSKFSDIILLACGVKYDAVWFRRSKVIGMVGPIRVFQACLNFVGELLRCKHLQVKNERFEINQLKASLCDGRRLHVDSAPTRWFDTRTAKFSPVIAFVLLLRQLLEQIVRIWPNIMNIIYNKLAETKKTRDETKSFFFFFFKCSQVYFF